MARLRNAQSIVGRLDPDAVVRGHSLRRSLSLFAAFLAAGWLLAMAVRDDLTPYSGGPLSVRHAILTENCRTCHLSGWGDRLLDPRAYAHTMDTACLACHPAPAHHRNQTEMIRGESAAQCAECHTEHQGRGQLAELKPEHCTRCHADLKRNPIEPDVHADGCLLGRDHAVAVRVTDLRTDHPEFAFLDKKTPDPTKLKFNHRAHLVPETKEGTALVRAKLAELAPRRGIGRGVGGAFQLECGYCHEPERSGAYMKPLNYERHCGDCHPLGVPHEGPDAVRDFLRSRGTEQTEAEIYATGCATCHETGGAARIAPTGFGADPRRWFVHSRFDHGAHRELLCTQCHVAATLSTRTADVLLPGRWLCALCHREPDGARSTCVECHLFHDHRRDVGVTGSMRIGTVKD